MTFDQATGFHSAFGEDAQIFSREEIVKELQLFDSHIQDAIDRRLALLREVRELYQKDRELYQKIKDLPVRAVSCAIHPTKQAARWSSYHPISRPNTT